MPSPESFHSSLKRCDLYDNPYNAKLQAHPAIVKQRKTVRSETDSISSAQRKLEKELFETFKQNNFNFSNGKMFFIGTVGKYAFLAAVLPVYLFFYGIPKWILSEVGPNSFRFIKNIFSNIGSRVAETASHIAFGALSIIQKVTDPILNFISTHIEKGRELYLNAKQKCIVILNLPKKWMDQLFKPVADLYKQISQFFTTIGQNLSRLAKAIHHHRLAMRKAFINFPKKVMKYLQPIPDIGKQMLSRIFSSMNPIINTLKNSDKKLSRIVKAAKDYTNQVIDRVIKQPFNSVKQLVQKFRQSAVDRFNAVVREPIALWASPKIERAARFINQTKEKVNYIRERIRSKFHALSERAEEFIDKLKEHPSQVLSIIPQPVLSLFTPLTLLFNFVREVPSKFKHKKRSIREETKKFKQKIKKQIVRLKKKCLAVLQRNSAKIKPFLIFIIKKITDFLIKATRVIKEMLTGGFFLLRMMFAWMKIFLRHGLFLVRETCTAWFPSIR